MSAKQNCADKKSGGTRGPDAQLKSPGRNPPHQTSAIRFDQPELAVEFQLQSVVEGDLMVAAVAFDTPDVAPRIVRSHEFQDRLRNQPSGTTPFGRSTSVHSPRASKSIFVPSASFTS